MNGVFLIWLVIIVLNIVARLLKKGRSGSDVSLPPPRQGPDAPTRSVNRPRREQSAAPMRSGGMPRQGPEGTMRFGSRPDLEPGYMYLNGVKVLIKEADKIEFLK